jgi:hypothetical protein
METAKAQHPSEALAHVLDRITEIFSGRVGQKPAPDKLAAIRKEGEERYARQIPPGYRDAKKTGADTDKFGDLIIWKDLIDKAKADQKPVVFISDDVKEDWWHVHRGQKLGPRPELLEEFRTLTGQDFHIYELGQFLRLAAERHKEIGAESVEQIEQSVLEDERARRRVENSVENIETAARTLALEDERDAIISALAGVPGARLAPPADQAEKVILRQRLIEIEKDLGLVRAAIEAPATEG